MRIFPPSLRRALAGLVVFAAIPLAGAAAAAEIAGVTHAGKTVLRITGVIKAGDYDHFKSQMDAAPGADVLLSSDGGDTDEALDIGRLIRAKKSTTIVPTDKSCASACGLIWLAGTHRAIEGTGKVGFHATYFDDDAMDVSAEGNALVGAYLADLGYSDSFVIYASHAEPDDMRWLTPADSHYFGIDTDWRRPNPPNPNIIARRIVEFRLRNERLAGLLKDNYPRTYAQFVSDVYAGDMDGEPWLNALYHGANRIRLPLIDDRSLSTAVYETFNREYIDVVFVRFGELLLRHNDEKCYALFKEKHQPSSRLFADGPDELKLAYLDWFASALDAVVKSNGMPLKHVPITAADEAYGKRQLKKAWRHSFATLSSDERHRLLAAKPSAEKVLRCKLYLGTLRAALADQRLTRLLFQPDKLGTVAIDPPG